MFYLLIVLSITGNQIINKVDSLMNAPEDREATMKTIVIDKNGKTKERETKMYEKENYRLIRFLSPAEDRGVGFLSLSEDKMYVYLPSFNKIRRIASHIKKQSFMDTDFSYDDLGSSKYKGDWNAKVISENDSTWVLKLTPKPGKNTDYSMLKMVVKKNEYLIKSVEFFMGNKLKKKMIMKDYKKINNYWSAQHIEMKNIEKNHKTIMKLENVKFDQGLPDNIFTKRNLKRI